MKRANMILDTFLLKKNFNIKNIIYNKNINKYIIKKH